MPGMKISHTPLLPSTRMGRRRPSQLAKGPHQADPFGIGRPHGKAHAGHLVKHRRMRAQHAPRLHVPARAEQLQVSFAQCWCKAIGVDALVIDAMVVGPLQARVARQGRGLELGFEEVGAPAALQWRAIDQARTAGRGCIKAKQGRNGAVMAPQHRVGIMMATIGDALQLWIHECAGETFCALSTGDLC